MRQRATTGFAAALAGPVHDEAAVRALLRDDAPVPSLSDFPVLLGGDPYMPDGHDHQLLGEVRALIGWIASDCDASDPPPLVDDDLRGWAIRQVAAHPTEPWAMRLLARLGAESA